MTEEESRTAQAQAREFPETMKIIERIRDALAAKLFQTTIDAKNAREDIYLRVQALDTMKDEMAQLLSASAGDQAIKEYVEKLATTGK